MAENPQVKGGVIAYLQVNGAARAVEFYKKAFGAEVAGVQPPDPQGRTMHAHVYINGSSVMLSDPFPEHGHPLQTPAAFSLMLDFEMATQTVRAGAPAKFAWYIAFGLMTTLVWLYIEILRLLSYLRQE